MLKRLNGVQRIGVVLSAIWVLIGFFYGRSMQIENAKSVMANHMRLCSSQASVNLEKCLDESGSIWVDHIQIRGPQMLELALIAFLPVVLGWLVGWVAVMIYRWVRAGFKPK